MTNKLCRLVCLTCFSIIYAIGCLPQSASALDTANVLMNIDGMAISHQGIFRNFTPADGAQTFSYGTFQTGAGGLGRYKSFLLAIPGGAGDLDGCCISHRIMLESWGPQTVTDPGPPPVYGAVPGIDITNAYFPVIDRAGFGTLVDPSEYQIEVKFKPILTPIGTNPAHTAKEINVALDRHYGYVYNAEKDSYERGLEAINYTIGINSDADYNNDGFINNADRDIVLANMGMPATVLQNRDPFNEAANVTYQDLTYWEDRQGRVVTPINTWYATAPKDANGFATWSVPLTQNVGSGRTTNINYGDAAFRDANTVTGGGRVQNPDNFTTPNAYEDVQRATDGPLFGGGPEDPNEPGSKLNTPNGYNLMYFGKNGRRPDPVLIEVLSVALTRINPGPIAARIDEYSGISGRFGSGFTRSATDTPINVPGDSIQYLPPATDQISRFDQNGLTNLIFNMRTPDDPANETHRFYLRYGPSANTFDGTDAMVNVRAKLLPGNEAQTLQIVAKDLDGNDTGAMTGADEYTFNLALNQFNASTFTTVSIPLSSFSLSTHVPRDDNAGTFGSGPGGFVNAGDGSITEFNLYEFAGLLVPNSGLLKLELDYMEIRLPVVGLAGDYNGNGTVDAADYVLWRNDPASFGGNPDGYNTWRANFGRSSGSGSAATAAVPEPATLWLIGSLLAWVAMGRPWNRRFESQKTS